MYIFSRCDEQIIAENIEQAMLDGRVPNSEKMSRCPFCREGPDPLSADIWTVSRPCKC